MTNCCPSMKKLHSRPQRALHFSTGVRMPSSVLVSRSSCILPARALCKVSHCQTISVVVSVLYLFICTLCFDICCVSGNKPASENTPCLVDFLNIYVECPLITDCSKHIVGVTHKRCKDFLEA